MAKVITKWCSSGKDQYSVRLIDQLDDYQDSLLPIAKKNQRKKKSAAIPSRMIINHFKNPYPRPNYIEGVNGFSYLKGNSNHGPLNVYILYDVHKVSTDCENSKVANWQPVNEWIMDVLQSSDVFVDVFLESSWRARQFFGENYVPRVSKSIPGTLAQTVDQLHECLFDQKCSAPNIRVHGVDIRGLGRNLKTQISDIVQSEKFDTTKWHSLKKKIKKMIVDIIETEKMKKEMKDAPACIKKILIKSVDGRLEYFKPMIEHALNFYMSLIPTINMIGGAIIMDIYALSRLFKRFNIQQKDRGMPDIISNVIIYTGGVHSEYYKTTLKQCGFDVVFDNSPTADHMASISTMEYVDDKLCVDVRKLPYPLFR